MDDKLMGAKQPDQFTTESPIRAFTEFRVAGCMAIGKGFRPSVAHLHTYLDAMARKESWRFVQLLHVDTKDMTIIFERQEFVQLMTPLERTHPRYDRFEGHEPSCRARALDNLEACNCFEQVVEAMKAGDDLPINPMPDFGSEISLRDDPVNPKHYAGRECADIGERLTANGYQVLKYCWRLGKKDDPCQELGKALWYLDSEAKLMKAIPSSRRIPVLEGIKHEHRLSFLEDRIADQPTFTQNIARMLWEGYSQRQLICIREAIDEHRFHLDCGRGLAI